MPSKDEDEEDEGEDFEGPFDFFNLFKDPNKLFKSKQFRQIFKDIFEKLAKNLPPEFQNLSPEEMKKIIMDNKDKFPWGKFKGPYMAGFNVTLGPDGKPIFDSFGNIKPEPSSGKPEVNPLREPLVEVNEEPDQIIIIAEMPGVSKEDVELKATSRTLTISTKSDSISKKYHKEIELPCAINSDYAKATIRNGILSVKLKKIEEKSNNIKIE